MRLNKKENIIFVIVVVILLIGIFVVNNQPKEVKELPRVKLIEQGKNKQFALMVEQTKGKGDYKESNNNELPLGGYKFNEEKSGCTDINGKVVENVLSYDYDTYTVLLDTSKTLYCYLYYDKDNIINYLRSTDTEKHLSQKPVGDMYRYQGLYIDDVRNYICLGEYCCNNESCSRDDNDDMYRIVGITENGELKVIKKTALSNTMQWWNERTIDIKWPQSLIYQKLNGKSDDGSTNPNLTDLNSYYYSLDSKLKKLIITDHYWLYGDTSSSGSYNGNTMYEIESGNSEAPYHNKEDVQYKPTGKYKWNEKIEAPMGLMYMSDYYYAYKTSEEDAGNPGSKENAVNSWIHISHNEIIQSSDSKFNERTMSRYGLNPTDGTFPTHNIWENGAINANTMPTSCAVRPTFYLLSNIELSGEGTLENPFKIQSSNE